MIRRRHVWFLPLIAFCWVAWAATAAAECAWVLWKNAETVTNIGSDGAFETSTASGSWRPTDAYLSRQECLDVLERDYHTWPNKPLKVGDGRNVYRCLPDTVDLRGPKGGAR
jgi:hypothetical protein